RAQARPGKPRVEKPGGQGARSTPVERWFVIVRGRRWVTGDASCLVEQWNAPPSRGTDAPPPPLASPGPAAPFQSGADRRVGVGWRKPAATFRRPWQEACE